MLTAINHPVTLAPNPIQGYTAKAPLIADLCNRYPQVESVTLNGLDGDAYFIDLKDGLTREVGMNVPLAGSQRSVLAASNWSEQIAPALVLQTGTGLYKTASRLMCCHLSTFAAGGCSPNRSSARRRYRLPSFSRR